MSDADSNSIAAGQDRRTDERYLACFPAHVNRSDGKTRMALIHDLSVSGALLFTRTQLEAGSFIELALYLVDDTSVVRRVPARVVRSAPRGKDRSDVWHFTVAVQFDEPLAGCEVEIKALADRQRALGLPPE